MLKSPKLLALTLLLVMAVTAVMGPMHTSAATYSADDRDKVAKLCATKTGISQSSKDNEDQKVLGACEAGYFIGIEHPADSSPCSDSYSGDSKALHACKSIGFPLGKTDPLKIKPSGSATPGTKTPSCDGSSCAPTPTGAGQNCDENQCDLINLYVNPTIRILSILVGLVVAASLVLGGVQYAASSGDPQKVSAAKSRITNTLMAFFAYAFLYAFLNFLIPGGVFR